MAVITAGNSDYTNVGGYLNASTVFNVVDTADGTGILNKVYLRTYHQWVNIKAGTFYGTASLATARDYASLGDCVFDTTYEFTGLSIDVETGDFLGWYSNSQNAAKYSSGSGWGSWRSGDSFATGGELSYSNEDWKICLYATGFTGTGLPTVTTQAVSDIDVTTATGNGNVTDGGADTVTERGVCVALTENPTISDTKFTAAAGGSGVFTAAMTGLTSNTNYHARAFATNTYGTSYGSDVTFKTLKNSYALNPNKFTETDDIAVQCKGLTIPSWKADGKPASPANGEVGYNRDTHCFEIYDANTTAWVDIDVDLLHNALTLGTIGSTPNEKGASLSTQELTLQPANASYGGVVSTSAQTFAGKKTLQDGLRIGDDTDYSDFDANGFHTSLGGGSGLLTLRPNLVQSRTKISDNKPTEVNRGCNIGYSFPIWNDSTNSEEELYFRMRIPARWDGTTDPQFGIICTITGAEDVGDKFKFQLEWQTTDCGGDSVMGTTTSNCVSEQTIITGGGTAYTAYCLFFTLNADDATNPIVAGDMLQGRLRRIAASANEVTAEIAVWDWAIMWKTARMFGAYQVESNVT